MGYYKEEFEGSLMVGATCDSCGAKWFHWDEGWQLMPDELSLWEELDDAGWEEYNKKLTCLKCSYVYR